MATIQDRMKETLSKAGIPYAKIECYGSQIVITSGCRDTAARWASLLARFATVKGVVKSSDDNKVNMNTVLRPSSHIVWRTFAVV